MGAVYEGTDLRLNRAVAVKIMKGSLFGDPTALRRFNREAHAAARLNHPNIVRIFDFGSLAGNGAYQVLEFVRGRSWRAALKAAGQWSPQFALPLLRQVLEGLECAHAAGVIHRDLKPENILLDRLEGPDGETYTARILDFGLAKQLRTEESPETTSVTRPDIVMGTYGYMSPEQMAGGEVDHRTDIYSFGVILIETLTGPLQLRSLYLHEQIDHIMDSRFGFPGATSAHIAVCGVVSRAVARRRSDRYSQAAELSKDLKVLAECPPFPDHRAAVNASADRLGTTATMRTPS
jgi:serine/threonine protein kinase